MKYIVNVFKVPRIILAAVIPVMLVATSQALVAVAMEPSGKKAPIISATPTRGLNPAGNVITVSGRNFDQSVGIYVAFCVTPSGGEQPSPCGGGVNIGGASAASVWISSNPPPYGSSLATPYLTGGRFKVRVAVSALIGSVDCRKVSCAVVTRADHTRPGDRRFDTALPVSFLAQ